MLCFRVLPRTSLVNRTHRSTRKARLVNNLAPLEISCLSFRASFPLFSAACSLFAQNARGGVCPSSDPTPRWVLTKHRFASPLFSYSYELLFSEVLCFDNDLRCPLCFRPTLPIRRGSASRQGATNGGTFFADPTMDRHPDSAQRTEGRFFHASNSPLSATRAIVLSSKGDF